MGATLLLAASVLLFVSSWLLGQREARHWQQKLKTSTQAAIGRGSLLTLFAIGFLAIFREGVETVLFIMALMSSTTASVLPVVAGGLLALVILLAAFVLVRATGLRLPLSTFFTFTAWTLLALAIIGLAGNTLVLNRQLSQHPLPPRQG